MVWTKYASLFDLTGKVVLVAGGGGAIGAALAEAAAGFGAKIAIGDISQAGIDRTVAQLMDSGAEAMGVQINATEPASVAAAVAAVEAHFGKIDALVNTVGTHIEQPAEDVTAEAWDRVVDVNLKGAFLLSQGVARSMIAHQIKGSIFHITSVRSGLGIRRGYAAYCAEQRRPGHPDQAVGDRMGQARHSSERHCADLHAYAFGQRLSGRPRLLQSARGAHSLGARV